MLRFDQQQAADGGEGDADGQMTEEEKQEKRLSEGIGIPHIVIKCSEAVDKQPFLRIIETEKLPSPDEVPGCTVYVILNASHFELFESTE